MSKENLIDLASRYISDEKIMVAGSANLAGRAA